MRDTSSVPYTATKLNQSVELYFYKTRMLSNKDVIRTEPNVTESFQVLHQRLYNAIEDVLIFFCLLLFNVITFRLCRCVNQIPRITTSNEVMMTEKILSPLVIKNRRNLLNKLPLSIKVKFC